MKKEKEKPIVSPGDWIRIGSSPEVDAVVCTVYEDNQPGDLEVVYLSDRNRAINEDIIWRGAYWEFLKEGPCGGYADNYSRLSEFVAILKRGRYR